MLNGSRKTDIYSNAKLILPAIKILYPVLLKKSFRFLRMMTNCTYVRMYHWFADFLPYNPSETDIDSVNFWVKYTQQSSMKNIWNIGIDKNNIDLFVVLYF